MYENVTKIFNADMQPFERFFWQILLVVCLLLALIVAKLNIGTKLFLEVKTTATGQYSKEKMEMS